MQFRLSTIFVMMLVLAASMAMAGVWGIAITITAILLRTALLWGVQEREWIPFVILLIIVPPAIAGFQAYCDGKEPFRNTFACTNNLLAISSALHAYEQNYGQYPPPYLCGNDGKPAHSWRVLILPYLGYSDAYRLYDFSETWGGPNNRRLFEKRPVELVCPSDSATARKSLATSYVAVVGPNTMWDVNQPVKHSEDITHDYRVVAVEVADSDIVWTEPRDLPLDDAVAGINLNGKPSMASHHDDPGAHMALAYGASLYVRQGTSESLLRTLLAGKAGESELERLRKTPRFIPSDPARPYRIGFVVISVLLFLCHGIFHDRIRK